jgi:hypothetical protein
LSPITARSKLEAVRAMIAAKQTWLNSFGSGRNKRPDFEISQKHEELTMLNAIAADYARMVKEEGR